MEVDYRQRNLKIRGPETITLKYGNTTEKFDMMQELHLNNSNFGDMFPIETKNGVFRGIMLSVDIQITARYLQLHPERSETSDACAVVSILGCGDTGEVSYVSCFSLSNTYNYAVNIATRSIPTPSRTNLMVYADRYPTQHTNDSDEFGLFRLEDLHICHASSRYKEKTNSSALCRKKCEEEPSCNAAVYNGTEKTCHVYETCGPSSVSIKIKEIDGIELFQKLYEAVAYRNLILESQVTTIITGPSYVCGYGALQEITWTIDFTTRTKYPVLVLESFNSGGQEVQHNSIHSRNGRQIMFRAGVASINVLCSTGQTWKISWKASYDRYVYEIKQKPNGIIRGLLYESDFPTNPHWRDFPSYGFLYSDAFLGFINSSRNEFVIDLQYTRYIEIEMLLFHVSCGVGSAFKITTPSMDKDYCNLNRPWKEFRFPPVELPIKLLMVYSQVGDSRPVDGFAAAFELGHYTKHVDMNNISKNMFDVGNRSFTARSVCNEFGCYAYVHSPYEDIRLREATAICSTVFNGGLASILSSQELRFVRHFLESDSRWFVNVHIGTIRPSASSPKGVNHWSDGTPVVFPAWSETIPNKISTDSSCVVMMLRTSTKDNVLDARDCGINTNAFLCKNSTNIQGQKIGTVTLPDVPTVEYDNSTEFACGSGEYLSVYAVCDGHKDCADGSDEKSCRHHDYIEMHNCHVVNANRDQATVHVQKYASLSSGPCNINIRGHEGGFTLEIAFLHYFLNDSEITLSLSDGKTERVFGMEDTKPEVIRTSSRSLVIIVNGDHTNNEAYDIVINVKVIRKECPGMFQCDTGTCIPFSMYCDNVADCNDESDEKYCDYGIVDETQFKCWNGKTISRKFVCDSSPQCLDKSDELGCDKCSDPENANVFSCKGKGGCIAQSLVCNGVTNCENGIDEEDCAPNKLSSCSEWWNRGYRKTQLYTLTDGEGVITVECNFDTTEDTGKLQTIFHGVDFAPLRELWEKHNDQVRAELVYASRNAIFAERRTSDKCKQTFTQTCLPNRRAISERINLTNHREYWDCLCISMALEQAKNESKYSFEACSDATATLVNNGTIHLEDIWTFSTPSRETGFQFMPREIARYYDRLPPESYPEHHVTLQFGPITCEREIEPPSDLPRTLACEKGKPVSSTTKCLYDIDDMGNIVGCADFTHLLSCQNFSCPNGYAKCPNSFCVAARFICDGENDCVNGEDETNCILSEYSNFLCVGYFRCMNTSVCIPKSQKCDGIVHCRHGDDERLCEFQCPKSCSCHGYDVTCQHIDSKHVLHDTMPINTRFLDMSEGKFTVSPVFHLPYLGLFNLSKGEIVDITADAFISMRNLLTLDLSMNKIKHLNAGSFGGLLRLRNLIIHTNMNLHSIEPGTFHGLTGIKYMRLSGTKIQHLEENTFNGLTNLAILDLTNCGIIRVNDHSFMGLSVLKILNISHNDISTFKEGMFEGLDSLFRLETDAFVFCCLKPESVSDDQCSPAPGVFSSCEDLMRSDGPRFLLWIIGAFALLGNSLSLLYRFVFDRSRFRIGYGVFVTNLTVADFFMGIYLVIIAGVDVFYRQRYIWNDKIWRHSALCSFAGFLSTLSSEASVFFICLITLDRVLVIKYPYGDWKFTTKIAICACGIVWIICLLISALPFLFTEYFQDSFYSSNAVCLALPLTRNRPAGWEYSVTIFIFFNFLTFLLIAIGQSLIYHAVITTGEAAKKQKRQGDLVVARNLLLVVSTDFLCWCPIGIMGLMAMADVEIPGEVYVWATVLILPINSALNPFLYTLSAIVRKKKFAPTLDEQIKDTTFEPETVVKYTDVGRMEHVLVSHSMPLGFYLQRARCISVGTAVRIICILTQTLICLHEVQLCIGEFGPDDVRMELGQKEFTVTISISPKQIRRKTDGQSDVYSLGMISNLLISACKGKGKGEQLKCAASFLEEMEETEF